MSYRTYRKKKSKRKKPRKKVKTSKKNMTKKDDYDITHIYKKNRIAKATHMQIRSSMSKYSGSKGRYCIEKKRRDTERKEETCICRLFS